MGILWVPPPYTDAPFFNSTFLVPGYSIFSVEALGHWGLIMLEKHGIQYYPEYLD